MKPSTIVALLIATVVGLIGLSASRVVGLMRSPRQEGSTEAVKVLVAAQNILKGNLIDPKQVIVRPLKPGEKADYQVSNAEYLPPMESAVYLRIAKENILADSPIKASQLEPLENPDGVPERLAPNMQPVNLSVLPKDSVGGLLRVGDWVNVYMNVVVSGPGLRESPRRALIVPNARVILKRNTLRPIYASISGDKPIPFTLETNTYRAALCEFARDMGEFSLVAIPEAEARSLEERRKKTMELGQDIESFDGQPRVSFLDLDSENYKKELALVSNHEKDLKPITNYNLQQLFDLDSPHAPLQRPKRTPIRYIEQYHGTRRLDDVTVTPDRRILRDTSTPGSRSKLANARDIGLQYPTIPTDSESGETELPANDGSQHIVPEFQFMKPSQGLETKPATRSRGMTMTGKMGRG